MTNQRYLVSRNKREGWYTGKHRNFPQPDKNWYDCEVKHFRSKLGFKALKERVSHE